VTHPYRLGFAVKVLGAGGLRTADSRRPQSAPHLRHSLELLGPVFDYLDAHDLRMYRLSSGIVPYGTHPDRPEFDYRRQLDACAEGLAALGRRALELGVRLSTHPGQYTVLSALDPDLVRRSALDVEQDSALLDALGAGPEAVVVVHVGGAYGDAPAALDRWARAWEQLSEPARRRVVVEHDERLFDLADVLTLHARVGVRVVFDLHHHRLNPAPGLEDPADALGAAYATWPGEVRPKAHLSSPRTDLPDQGANGRLRLPRLDRHSDVVPPWELAALLAAAPGPLDVMLEAKAKDLAVRALRAQLERLDPELAEAEERGVAQSA